MSRQIAHIPELSDTLPKWLQVATALESEIERRIANGNLRLPTEAELSKSYSVSLVTMRKALDALEDRGLVSRKRKRGTFILPEGIVKRTPVAIGSMEDLINPRVGERAELLFAEVVAIPNELSDRFSDQVNVMKLIQCRLVGGEPSIFEVDRVRLDIATQIDLNELEQSSVWWLLSRQAGVEFGRIKQGLTAKPAWPEVAEYLGVELLSPVMVINSECFDSEGRLLGIGQLIYRGDKFDFRLSVDSKSAKTWSESR